MLRQKRHQAIRVGILNHQQFLAAFRVGVNRHKRLITPQEGRILVFLREVLPKIHAVVIFFAAPSIHDYLAHSCPLGVRIVIDGVRAGFIVNHLGIKGAVKVVRGVLYIKAVKRNCLVPQRPGRRAVAEIGAKAGPVMVGLIINILVL